MSDNAVVSIEDLWVRYRTNIDRRPTLKAKLARKRRNESTLRTIDAVKGVSLDVQEREILGIVGANGAGKSTLLRTIAGILPPSEGRVTVRGDVTTLLALGLGFNAELTGRENIRLGSLAAGLSLHELSSREEEIANFADIGDFIDLPMRTYSTGMYGRLGFAVAVHLEPDILVIDEALSAGDAAFQEKAAKKIRQLIESARAILLVSHSLSMVKDLATDCIWLDKGKLVERGEPGAVIESYKAFAAAKR